MMVIFPPLSHLQSQVVQKHVVLLICCVQSSYIPWSGYHDADSLPLCLLAFQWDSVALEQLRQEGHFLS